MTQKIYLDYNATTPVDNRVLECILPYFSEKFGNASSSTHSYGWDAEEAVNLAREQVARLIGAKQTEITFTSGATEAINLGLFGVCESIQKKGNHIITCCTEHKVVLDISHEMEKRGFEVTYLPVDHSGAIDLDELKDAITPQTILVCVMHANNEIGVIHPLKAISKLTRERNVLLMTDATQSVGKIPFSVQDFDVDLAAFSAHKLYGPKGAGALYIRKNLSLKLAPQLFGGGQEQGLRPGTLNVPAIVGLGKACEICSGEMTNEGIRLGGLRDFLEKELRNLDGVMVNGGKTSRLPHMTNLTFQGIDGSKLIRTLKHLAVSQGSACTSSVMEPSHVLKSLGHSDELALSSVRIGLGRFTTEDEVRLALEWIKEAIFNLRLATA